MTEPIRTLTDDIYDALGMPGTWWMGRLRLAHHIGLKLKPNFTAYQAYLTMYRDASNMLKERDDEIEALKRNIDELQGELTAARAALDVAIFAAKKRKPKATKKK